MAVCGEAGNQHRTPWPGSQDWQPVQSGRDVPDAGTAASCLPGTRSAPAQRTGFWWVKKL